MDKLYYLGKAEYLKYNEDFKLPHIVVSNISDFVISNNYIPIEKTVPHKSILDVYLYETEGKGIILSNPIRTDKYFYFTLNQKTLNNILSKTSVQDSVGDIDLFLVVLKEMNLLETIT
jgi:hypothetical protein